MMDGKDLTASNMNSNRIWPSYLASMKIINFNTNSTS